MRLTDEQQAIVDAALSGTDVFVDACIGSGKTTVIQRICQDVNPSKRVLYLTYNRLLKLDAQARIRKRNVRVTNYDGFAWWILHSAGVADVSYQDMMPTLLSRVASHDIVLPSYDLIVVDEYQDVKDEYAKLLQDIVDASPGCQRVAVGDMRQKLYDTTTIDAESFIRSWLRPGFADLSLTHCFRLSEDVAANIASIWGSEIHGVNPDFRIREVTSDEALERCLACEPSDLLVLGASYGGMTWLANRLFDEDPDRFNKGTVYIKTSKTNAVDPTPDVAIFSTFDGSKGMERPVCVVFDWTESYLRTRASKPDIDLDVLRNLFCVAVSRGKCELLLVRPHGVQNAILSKSSIDKILAPDDESGEASHVSIESIVSHKYAEDLEDAYGILHVDRFVLPDAVAPLSLELSDGLIDLGPVVSFMLMSCFDSWSPEDELSAVADMAESRGRDGKSVVSRTLDRAARRHDYTSHLEELALTTVAVDTGQWRYFMETRRPVVSERELNVLSSRVHVALPADTLVQEDVSITFAGTDDHAPVCAKGLTGPVTPDAVWSVGIGEECLSHEAAVACMLEAICLSRPNAALFDVSSMTIVHLTCPNRDVFLDAVARLATKRHVPVFHGRLLPVNYDK